MNKKVFVAIIVTILIGCSSLYAQNNKVRRSSVSILKKYTEERTNNTTKWGLAIQRSKSGDAYQFMALRRDFGFINEMIYSNDLSVIEKGVALIDNVISTAKTSSSIKNNKTYKDNFKGWISREKDREYHKEVALYESYSFFYITQFLYLLREIGWVEESDRNRIWWQEARAFVEDNIWDKWRTRSITSKRKQYWYFLRQRTHMGSHWAGTAMYLGALTQRSDIKQQTKEVQKQYDTLLKRNLKTVNNAYIWHSTYDNVAGTEASGTRKPIIQDVSHGNHVVAYVVAAYEFGNPNWNKDDILKLSNTLKNIVYDKKKNVFRDNVDGTSDGRRPGWGNFIADGWAKLASYDSGVRDVLIKFGNTDKLAKYYQDMQYEATMFKSDQLR